MILIYFLACSLAISITYRDSNLSLLWLPAGVAIAVIFRYGKVMIPAIFIAILLTELWWKLSIYQAILLAIGSTTGPAATCWMLHKKNFDLHFAARRDVLWFTMSSLAGAMISATFGTLALSILSGKPFTVSTWYIWVAGDTVGALLASPVLLAISRHSLRALEHKKEILMFLILLVAANWFVFLSPYNYLRLSFVIVAMMIWAAMRFSLLTVSSITLALAIFSTWAASNNLGRFSSFEASGLVVVWAYVSTIALIALMINTMRSENAIASKKINETYQRLNKVTSRLPGLAIQYRVRSDKTTSIPYASIGILQMLEVSHQDVKDNAQQLIDRIDPRDVETARQQLAQATRELSPWQTEFRFYRLDGSVRWLFVDGLPEREADGAMLWHCFLSDITDRKQAERDLHIAACTFESQEGIFITDANWKILKVNQAFTRITGFTAEDMLGKRPPVYKSDEQDSAFFQRIFDSLKEKHFWNGELWSRRRNGEAFPQMLTLTAIMEGQEISNYVASFTDISLSKSYEADIRKLAFYDSLTQLPNRRLLMDRLEHLISVRQRNSSHSAIFFIDLDNFKNLNDTRGHDAGDLLLIETAKRLSSCIRESDTVGRLGGDEFVVILEELSADRKEAIIQADKISEKVRQILSEPYQIADFEHHGSSSIGVCLFQGDEITVKDLFKRADTAMYEAKTAGRNTVRFFDPAMQAILLVRMLLESNLRLALSQNQFQLYYQVQVNADGKFLGAEALIRWWHPDRGFISPAEFIPLAEETGLIIPIGQWVLETACAQLKQWEKSATTSNLSLAVNVSAKQFQLTSFVETLSEIVARHQINPALLKIELTESAILDNIDATTEKMRELKKLGIAFSMDDFGTGYSSLAYLQRLPLNQLKIDQSFVRDLSHDENDATIVRAIIALGINLGLNVIAEGVETSAQRAFLIKHSCTAFQGYLFSKPLPMEEFMCLLEQEHSAHTKQAQIGFTG